MKERGKQVGVVGHRDLAAQLPHVVCGGARLLLGHGRGGAHPVAKLDLVRQPFGLVYDLFLLKAQITPRGLPRRWNPPQPAALPATPHPAAGEPVCGLFFALASSLRAPAVEAF